MSHNIIRSHCAEKMNRNIRRGLEIIYTAGSKGANGYGAAVDTDQRI